VTAIALVNGSKYWAGASRPFFISQGTVSSYLRGKGFSDIVWHERSEALPASVTPRSDPEYSDDWDEWVSADYNGPAGSISPPVAIPWLIVHLPSVAQQTTTTGTAKPPASTPNVPSWVTSSAQAGYAAAQAAAQAAAAAAAAAGAASPSAVSSGPAVPAQPTPTPSAPRDGQTANAGAAILATTGLLVVLGTFVAAILRRKRH
jgi:hypothetical protein